MARRPASSGKNWQSAFKRIDSALKGKASDDFFILDVYDRVVSGVSERGRPRTLEDGYPDDLDTLYELANLDLKPIKVDFTRVQYRGPGRSTRVSGVQFLPDMPFQELKSILVKTIEGEFSTQLLESRISGYMYVKWVKGDNVSSYGPMTIAEFRQKVQAVGDSWGKAVNVWGKAGYTHSAGAPEGLDI